MGGLYATFQCKNNTIYMNVPLFFHYSIYNVKTANADAGKLIGEPGSVYLCINDTNKRHYEQR